MYIFKMLKFSLFTDDMIFMKKTIRNPQTTTRTNNVTDTGSANIQLYFCGSIISQLQSKSQQALFACVFLFVEIKKLILLII